MRSRRRSSAAAVVFAALLAACSTGDDSTDVADLPDTTVATTESTEPVPSTTDAAAVPTLAPTVAPTTVPPTTAPPTTAPTAPSTTTEPTGPERLDVGGFVAALAADELNGRDNLTPESAAARALIVDTLDSYADPLSPDLPGSEAWTQEFADGVNVIGVQPGRGELAGEYVVVGAHYDHLGPGQCDSLGDVTDTVCNGAADNAAGVAAAIAVAERTSDAGSGVPRRTLVVGLWDAEEDGLLGALAYASEPPFPLEDTVAYVNFDIAGSSLLPSLSNTSIMIGAETGGPPLVEAAAAAADRSALDYARFSLLFGQGRSDHAVFADAGIPVVFFADASNGCYHTVKDDMNNVDLGKLELEIGAASDLVRQLLVTPAPPRFDTSAALTTFDDARELLALLQRGERDIDLLGPDAAARTADFLTQLEAIVGSGEAAYSDEQTAIVLGGAAGLIEDLERSPCPLPTR